MRVQSAGHAAFPAVPRAPTSGPSAQDAFAGIMAQAAKAGRTREEQARDAAEQFVAMTFVQPALKELRENNQAAPPFAPSEGEKQFRALLDAELAHRIVRKANYGLVDRVAHDLLKASPGR